MPGSLESAAVWRIIRGTETSPGVWTELFANGNDAKTNVWDDRASLSYS
ncbi:MAG: hypothetical protein KAJ03_06780 [Gammaproteobacteria bacterium]|nr:hypothetical protein [Gammaproteobacteria bacterium]